MALSERLKKVESLTQHLSYDPIRVESFCSFSRTNLETKQAEIGQLADVHQTLDRLQYLALLPQKLEESLKVRVIELNCL